jgi:hypothetical protein
MPIMTCRLCDPPVEVVIEAPHDSPLAVCEFNEKHYNRTHGHLAGIEALTGPGQDWHTRAIDAVKQLAKSGESFTFYDVAKIAGEPVNPRAEWGRFAQEVEHLSLAHTVGWQQSDRPTTKSSAVRTWRGGPPPERKQTA